MNKPKVITLFGIVFFVSILIFRFDIGYDYPIYYQMLYPVYQTEWIDSQEPVFRLVCYIINYFHLPPVFLFIIIGIITCFFVFKSCINYTDSLLLSFLTYLALYFETSYGYIRQGLALSIILFGYPYLINKQWGKYITICLLATMAHYSAFICLLYPFLYKYTTSFARMLFFCIVVLLCYKIGMKIMVEQFSLYGAYLDGSIEITGGRLMRFRNILFLLGLYLFSCFGKNNDSDKRLIRIGLIGSVFPFILGGHFGGRIAWYFMIYMCIVLPNVIVPYKQKIIHGIWATGLVALFLMTIYVAMGIDVKSPYTPYQTIFTNNLENPQFK